MKKNTNITLLALFAIMVFVLSTCSTTKVTHTATVMITLSTNDGGSAIGATIVLQNHGGASYQQAVTAETTIFTDIPYGNYSVVVSQSGYSPYVHENLSVQTPTVSHSVMLLTTAMHIGDIIQFGAHQWRVLDIQDGRALIISVNILERRVYHTSNTSITWSECSLRTYLNGTFYNSDSFSAADRSRIAQVTIPNPNNPTYGTNGGPATLDRIFLLSIAEAQQYFDSNADRVATYDGTASWWWLRSPGSYGGDASGVLLDGRVHVLGLYVYNILGGGVRPALWVNL